MSDSSNDSCNNPATLTVQSIVHHDGDVILLVGPDSEDKVAVQVSSKVLAFASKVFNAMLAPDRFREGTELAKQ